MKMWRYLLLSGALLAVAPTALGELSSCANDSGPTAVKRVAIDNGDLVIDILWSSTIPPGTLVMLQILNRVDDIVASDIVQAAPGSIVSYPLPLSPLFFAENGYWFKVRLAGPNASFQALDFPFLVKPCSPTEGCDYSVVEGIGTDTLTMDAELFRLLDELEASGSQDLLNDALEARPNLGLGIYWVADQITRLQAGTDTSECVCDWNASYDLNRPSPHSYYENSPSGPSQEHPDWEMSFFFDPGASFFTAGQILRGPKQTWSVSGGAQLGLHLRCRSILGGDKGGSGGPGTPGGAGGETGVSSSDLPVLVPCNSPCADAEIDITASAQSRALANAWSTTHHGARGAASASAGLFLHQQSSPSLTTVAAATADRPPGGSGPGHVGRLPGHQLWPMAGFGIRRQCDLCVPGTYRDLPGGLRIGHGLPGKLSRAARRRRPLGLWLHHHDRQCKTRRRSVLR